MTEKIRKKEDPKKIAERVKKFRQKSSTQKLEILGLLPEDKQDFKDLPGLENKTNAEKFRALIAFWKSTKHFTAPIDDKTYNPDGPITGIKEYFEVFVDNLPNNTFEDHINKKMVSDDTTQDTKINKLQVMQEGLQKVSGKCDGAVKRDGVGFAACDIFIGEKLSVKPIESWSDDEIYRAMDLYKKYRKQIGYSKDLEFTEEEYKEYANREINSKSIKNIDNAIIIKFEYDSELVSLVKDIKGTSYRSDEKFWYIPVNKLFRDNIKDLKNLETNNDFIIDQNAQEVFTRYEDKGPNHFFSMSSDNLILYIDFDKNYDLLSELKSINIFKKFNEDHWEIKVSDIHKSEIREVEKLIQFGKDNEFRNIDLVENIFDAINKPVNQIKLNPANFPVLKNYQLTGVEHILNIKSAYLGDTMGLGKTIQALTAIKISNSLPAIIVCPNTLKYNWENEAKKWYPDLKCLILDTKKEIKEGYDLYIVNYDILSKLKNKLIDLKPQFIVFDESHYIKNDKAQRTKVALEIVEATNPKFKLLLSGTCITNRPKELAPQLDLLGVLNKLVSKRFDFFTRYCNAHPTAFGWDMNGASNTKELNEKMNKLCYLRREKEEVLKELPAKQRTMITLDIDNRKEYEKAQTETIKELRKLEEIDIMEDLEKSPKGAQHLVLIEKLKQLALKGKMSSIIIWLNDFLDSDEKLVVFVHHKSAVVELLTHFPDALKITGEDSAESRQNSVDQFQNNPDKKLIICSIKAANTGITLTASSNVVFLELPWTPADLDQAEDRTHRIGQINNVNAYYLLAKNTIEDNKIYPLIEQKRQVFDAVARGAKSNKKVKNVSILKEVIKDLLKL